VDALSGIPKAADMTETHAFQFVIADTLVRQGESEVGGPGDS
jgi:hypothetical protein